MTSQPMLTLALTGDSLITRRVSRDGHPQAVALLFALAERSIVADLRVDSPVGSVKVLHFNTTDPKITSSSTAATAIRCRSGSGPVSTSC